MGVNDAAGDPGECETVLCATKQVIAVALLLSNGRTVSPLVRNVPLRAIETLGSGCWQSL